MVKKKSAGQLEFEVAEYLADESSHANDATKVSAREFLALLDHAGRTRDSLASCQESEVLHESGIARRAAKALIAARLNRPNADLERQRENMVSTMVRTARFRLDRLTSR
jgi:hypothetical protein